MSDYLYDAFVSYSHRDMAWGKWLQRRLETFHIPKDMRGERASGQRLRVFRDQTDLAGVELKASLRKELDVSRFLIVLCSPASAASSWVNDEILYFISLGRIDRIIPFIVRGEPNSEDLSLECYPDALRDIENHTYLGANVQEIGRNSAFLKLASILLDVRFNRLVDREKQRRLRTGLAISLITAVIASVGGVLLWRNAVVSRRNHELSYDIYAAALVSITKKDASDLTAQDVEFLRVSAEEGNSEAYFYISECYRNGWGVEQNFDEFLYWAGKGADAGDPVCMVSLGSFYLNGDGSAKNPDQAFYWDMRAAELGHPGGMLNVGICYEEGLGTEKDPAKALEWYERSAENGNDLGMYNLARCYITGTGTERNPEMAFYWITKLAETGNSYAMYNAGLMCQEGLGTEENPREAYNWYRKAADAGDADGAYKTGWCYENNYGAPDPAVEWYERAASLGNEEAAKKLEE